MKRNELILNCARDGRLDDITNYIADKKDVNVCAVDGRTLLINAAANSHSALVKLLLESGADVKITTNSGKTALNYALCSAFGFNIGGKKGDSSPLETVKLLLNHHCPVTKLDIAFGILFQSAEVLKSLLKKVSHNKKLLNEAMEYAHQNSFEYDIDEDKLAAQIALVRNTLKNP